MSDTRSPVSSVFSILMLMSRKRALHLLLTLTLMILVGVFEVVSIGALIPVLTAFSGTKDPLKFELPFLNSEGYTYFLTLETAAMLLILVSLLTAALRLLLTWVSVRFITGLGHDIDMQIFENFLSLKYERYIDQNSSELISAIEKVKVVIFGVMHPLFQGFVSFVIGLFIVTFLISLDPRAVGLAFGVVCFLYVVISFSVARTLEKNSIALAKSQTERIRTVKEAYGSFRDIIISKTRPFFSNKFQIFDFRYRNAQGINAFLQASPRVIIEGLAMSLLAAYALYALSFGEDNSNALPILGSLAIGAQRLLPLMQQVYYGWSAIKGSSELLMDVDRFSRKAVDRESVEVVTQNRFSNTIKFSGVSYRYPGSDRWIIENANFTVTKGEIVGVIGGSGSGKSTLIDLLMGLLQPTDGSIWIDRKPLKAGNIDEWHLEIAHVPQHIFLTDDTIAANIALGSKTWDADKIKSAIKSAQIERFIDDDVDGLDTIIGEGGLSLSGGQRQRIGIARALYNKAEVLVFDEATSALDTETEGKLLKAITELKNSPTIIMVTHKHENLKYCDKILKVSSGKVMLVSNNEIN